MKVSFNLTKGLILASLIACLLAGSAHSSASAQARVGKKVESEILKAEAKLGQAILKCDPAALDSLLTDYYASANEGSEAATTKRGTLASCRAGTLVYYKIEEGRKLSLSAETLTIEGDGRALQRLSSDDRNPESGVHIKRLWTRKNSNWVLISQTIQRSDERRD